MRERPGIDARTWLSVFLVLLIGPAPPLMAQPAPKAGRAAGADKPAARANKSEPAHDEQATSARPGGLRMSRAVVCTSIDGYEKYKPLVGSAQTSDEKLLVYYRPLRYKTDLVDGYYRAHLVQDNVLRRRGKKEVLRQKKKVVDYEPKSKEPLGPIFIKSTISLKGLDPGEYELTIVLYDVMDKGAPPSRQVVSFKVIPPHDTRPEAAQGKARDPFPEP